MGLALCGVLVKPCLYIHAVAGCASVVSSEKGDQLSPTYLLLALSLVVIAILLGLVIHLSRRKIYGHTDDAGGALQATGNTSISGASAESPEIHFPSPRLQPELDLASSEAPRYQRRNYLFSYQERRFHDLLSRNFGENWQIFAKVRMADLVDLVNEPKDRGRYINWILTRHLDFVICDKSRQRPLLVIELDDSSHAKYDRRESDQFKTSVFEQAGLPLRRFRVKAYNDAEVVNEILTVLTSDSVVDDRTNEQ